MKKQLFPYMKATKTVIWLAEGKGREGWKNNFSLIECGKNSHLASHILTFLQWSDADTPFMFLTSFFLSSSSSFFFLVSSFFCPRLKWCRYSFIFSTSFLSFLFVNPLELQVKKTTLRYSHSWNACILPWYIKGKGKAIGLNLPSGGASFLLGKHTH